MEIYTFVLLAVLAIASALGMVLSKNTVNSALLLVLNLLSLAGVYLLLQAQFLALIQILVYAGAIMVLFLFVIMLLNLSHVSGIQRFDWRKGVAFLLGVGLLAQLILIVSIRLGVVPDQVGEAEGALIGSAREIGIVLFSEYALPLEIVAVLLLAATIGAVMLARRKPI
jgi:NADH-quinone oxidoreductase subunit J